MSFIGLIEVLEAVSTGFALPTMFIRDRPDHWLILVTFALVHTPRIVAFFILILTKRSQNSRQGMYMTWTVTLFLNFIVEVIRVVMIYVSINNSPCWEIDTRYCTAETFRNGRAQFLSTDNRDNREILT